MEVWRRRRCLQAICEVCDGQVLQDGRAVDVCQILEGGHCRNVSAGAGQHEQGRPGKCIAWIRIGSPYNGLRHDVWGQATVSLFLMLTSISSAL